MTASGIITLTTDFGQRDPYVAMMKGVILSIAPDARLVDITHQITHGSIIEAAGLLHDTFPFFPKGTVHVAVVDPGVGSPRRPLAFEGEGHFFIGPDNGLFWPIIRDHSKAGVFQISESRFFSPSVSATFHGRDIFAPAAAHISRGIKPASMGPKIEDPIEVPLPKPKKSGGTLQGQVVRVDHFGNLITNIHRKDLESFLKSDLPVIQVGDVVIDELSLYYAEGVKGEPLALLGSSDWLEIAVNLGRAADLLGTGPGAVIGTKVEVSIRSVLVKEKGDSRTSF